MNDEFADLENELRRLQPRVPSRQLVDRIGALLSKAEAPRPAAAWWQRLGFDHLSAAFGWVVISPVLTAVIVALVVTKHASMPPSPSPTSASPVPAANGLAGIVVPELPRATNVLYQALDEGIVLDAWREPVHRVRYRSADLVQWRNPATGARWEVSYPREDVLLVPVQAD